MSRDMDIILNGVKIDALDDDNTFEIPIVLEPECTYTKGIELETIQGHEGINFVVECIAKPFKYGEPWTYYSGQKRFPRKRKKAYKKELGLHRFKFKSVNY